MIGDAGQHRRSHRSSFSTGLAALLAAAVLALLVVPDPSMAEGGSRHCSDKGPVGSLFVLDITAHRVSCRAARRFIVAVNDHRVMLKEQNTRYDGYFCRPRQTGAGGWTIRCARGQRAIRWSEGT